MNPIDWLSPAGVLDNGLAVLENGFAVRLTQALVHFVWQGAACGALAVAAAMALRRRSARLRYGVHVAVLALMLACLPLTFALVPAPAAGLQGVQGDRLARGERVAEVASAVDAPGTPRPMIAPSVERMPHPLWPVPAETLPAASVGAGAEGPGVDAVAAGAASLPARDTVGAEASASPALGLPVRIAPYTAGVYLLGVVLMLARLAVAVWGAHRLWRSAAPLREGELLALVDRLARRTGMTDAPAVAWCARVPVPVVVGIFRPIVLLPGSLATGMNPAQLEALLIHELAHIRRYDLLVNLMQRVVESLLFFHPAVWYVSRRISIERENCCDDSVLDSGCARVAYADALVRMAELCTFQSGAAPPGNAAVLAASGGGPSQFKQRVLRVLGREIGPSLHLTRGALLATLLLPAVFLLALAVMQLRAGSETADPDEAKSRPQTLTDATQVTRTLEASGSLRAADEAGGDEKRPDEARDAPRVSRLVSPDGRRAAYGQFAVGPQGQTSARLIVAGIDLTHRRVIEVPFEMSHEVLWFGNDQLAVSPTHDAKRYMLVSADDGRQQGTLNLPERCDVLYKRLSPDGQRVAYAGHYQPGEEREDVQHGLFVVDLKTQQVRQVLDESVKTAPAWSPDSMKLAIGAAGGYVKDYPLAIVTTDGDRQVFRAPAGTTEPQGIATADAAVTQLDVKGVGAAWSPDGRWLAFSTEVVRGGSWQHGIPLDGQIGVWDLEGRRLTLVSQPPMNTHDKDASRWEYAGSSLPVWSPDSRWLAYRHVHVVRGDGTDTQRESLWIAGRDGSGRQKALDHAADVAWTPDGQALIWVHEGQSGRIEVGDLPEPGDTPARPIGPFSVRGRVTDPKGQPLAGVEIRVARGWGTLRATEPVLTDAGGRYEVHFGPGMLSFDDPVNLQSALLSARKAGYYEQSLGEHGRLGMAYQRASAEAKADKLFRDIVYPGHPYELNLVMVEAARLEGRLVDSEGQPLADYKLSLAGENLPPGSSVLASLATDQDGRFSLDQVPLHPYHFTLGAGRVSISSQPLSFDRPHKHVVQLVYDSLAGTLTWQTGPEAARVLEPLITPATQTAIHNGLASLVRAQQEDGAIGSGKTYQKNIAVTALAGMAFLAAGSTPEQGEYAEPLRKCRDFVLNQVRRDGYITNPGFSSHGPMYEHAYATQFLALLQQRHPTPAVREKLQGAVDLAVNSQNNEGGWRYEPDSKSSDISVTGCQTVALELAALAGADVPKQTLDRALDYIRKCQNADGGFRYQLVNRAESRFPRSAAALLALELSLPQGDEFAAARAYVQRFKPSANELKYEPHFLYGHRYAALAAQRAGGDVWREWYAAIRDELLHRQNADGTWSGDAICPEYGTANACIILQLPLAAMRAPAPDASRDEASAHPAESTKVARSESDGTVALARQRLALADDRLRHAERLQQKGLVGPAQVEAARLEVLKARSAVEQARSGRDDPQQALEIAVLEAEHNLRLATERLEYTNRLVAKGFASKLQAEAARLAVEAAREKLNQARAAQKAVDRDDAPAGGTGEGTTAPRQADPADAQRDPGLAQNVSGAVSRGVAYLQARQKADGSWAAAQGGYEIGVTSLVTLALLESGVPPEDAGIARALDWLAARQANRTYEVALATLAFCRADPQRFKNRIERNVEWLSEAQVTGGTRGAWTYSRSNQSGMVGDNSNTGFALWALDAAAEAGVRAAQPVWQLALEYLAGAQNQDGSWTYTRAAAGPGTGSMTSSGIAGIMICTERLAEARGAEPPDRIESVERGFLWLSEHFSVEENPGAPRWLLYYLGALERASRRADRARIGERDWYLEGARHLLATQHARGYWRGSGAMESDENVATSLALLFLTGGRRAARNESRATDPDAQQDDLQGAVPSSPAAPPNPVERAVTGVVDSANLPVAGAEAELRTIRLRFHSTDRERWNEDTPIAGLRALVWRNDAAGTVSSRPMSFDADDVIARRTTGDDGAVTFQLAPGDYYVRWTSDKELPYAETRPRPFQVKDTPDDQQQGFGLTKGCTLVLKAVDSETGRGIPGVKFWWENELGEYWMQTVRPNHLGRPEEALSEDATDANGEYHLFWFRASEDTFGVDADTLPEDYKLAGPAEVKLNFRDKTRGQFRSGETIEHTFALARSVSAGDE